MLMYLVAGAAALDSFAVGIWIGKKWGNKIDAAHVQAIGAAVASEVTKVQAGASQLASDVKAVETAVGIKPSTVVPIATPVTAVAPDLQAHIDAAIAAATAKQTT
jgi:hypothetical protein